MVYLARKKIKGKEYLYAVKSLRLQDGDVKKIYKSIEMPSDAKKLNQYFDEKTIELFTERAEQNFAPMRLHDKNAFKKMEKMRLEYKKIISKLSKNQLTDLFDRFTVNYTYESNAIEGSSLTLKDVAIILREGVAVKNKDLREIFETKNSRKLIDLVLNKKVKVTEKSIKKIHSMLVKDMGTPKGYKKVPNYLHGRRVTTTPPERVSVEMKALIKWFNDNHGKLHPLQLAAQLHGRFEIIHPFEDGNGRVGRFLINAILVNKDYPPLIIRKTRRLSYFNALEDFDNGRPQPLEEFLYNRLKETHEKFFKVYVKYLT